MVSEVRLDILLLSLFLHCCVFQSSRLALQHDSLFKRCYIFDSIYGCHVHQIILVTS